MDEDEASDLKTTLKGTMKMGARVRRNAAVVLLLLLTAKAHSEDRLVRVFWAPDPNQPPVLTGDQAPTDKIITLLFIKEPCALDIMGSGHMRRAWQAAGAYQVGCWYPTLQDEYTYINGIGQMFHSEGVYWEAYPRGALHSDGSVTITEPNFDSQKFFYEVSQRITLEHIRALNKQAP